MPRKLAAFLVADAVGYSARVEADEAEAIAALSSTLALVDTALSTHGGKTVATAGDSVIARSASSGATSST